MVPTIQNQDIFVWISNGFDKMAAICRDFKWLGFWISDPIQNLDHLKNPSFLPSKFRLIPMSDPHCTFKHRRHSKTCLVLPNPPNFRNKKTGLEICFNQASGNNSTGYHYLSKTHRLENNLCKYLWQISGHYSSLHIHNYTSQNLFVKYAHAWYSYKHVGIQANSSWVKFFVLRVSTLLGYHYQASTQLRYQRFDIHLEDKP